MKKVVLIIGSIVLYITLHPAAHADIIAISTQFTEGGSTPTADTFELRFGMGFAGPSSPIFDTLTFSAASVGQTFHITQAEDPDYNSLIASLTDGISESVDYELSFDNFSSIADGASTSESHFFSPLPAGSNGIDFQGFQLDIIDVRIDSVVINPSDFTIQVTILVDPINTIPEPAPASLLLMAGGLLLACAKSRWWQQYSATR